LPATVNCADASTLRADAADARRYIAEQAGDRAQIIRGNRAKFLASLAVVAELRCKVSAGEVEALLEKALEVARVAETTRSEYEAAREWTEADLVAAEALALLVSQLPAPVATEARVGSVILRPEPTTVVQPALPEAARAEGILGPVLAEVRISEEGDVSVLSVVRGHPMLDDLAKTAAEQWEYRPTVLDGRAIPIIAIAVVSFVQAKTPTIPGTRG